MKEEKLLDLIGKIDDEFILESEKKKRKSQINKILLIAASFVLVFSITIKNSKINNKLAENRNLQSSISSCPSKEPRRILIYNNGIYQFLEGEYILNKNDLDKYIGDIKYNLLEDKSNYNKNFSSTYGINGKIYKLKNYNENFRIAVLYENKIYICEKVDEKNRELDIENYFKNSNLSNITKSIEVYDHFAMERLKVIDEKSAKNLLVDLEKSKSEKITKKDFEEIADAESKGGSFLLNCILEDGTSFKFYILPDLEYILLGDNIYKITKEAKANILNLTEDINRDDLVKNIAF